MPPLNIVDASGNQVRQHQTDSGSTASAGVSLLAVVGFTSLADQIAAIQTAATNVATFENDSAAALMGFASASQQAITDLNALYAQDEIDRDTYIAAYVDTINANLTASQGRGRLVVLYTANNVASIFYRMPAMTCEQLAPDASLGTGMHPAFLEDGVQAKALYVSAFVCSNVGGEAVSQPFAEPWTSVSRDAAIAACAATDYPDFAGKNRLWSVWDRAAIVHDASRLGKNPAGNTAYKAWHGDSSIVGEASTTAGRMLTGSMGAAANHTGLADGVADMVGNVFEWCSGLELNEGQILMNADNADPANIAGLSATDEYFSSSNPALTSGYSVPSITDAASQQKNTGSAYDYIAGASGFASMAGGSESLKRAAIAATPNSRNGAVYSRSHGSRAPIVGGSWTNGANAGLSALYLYGPPSYANSSIGFRSAFVA